MTLVQKGCWTGPPTGQTLFDDRALPPDYSVVRGCTTDLCNAKLMTHDSIPNLSPGEPEGGGGHGVGWEGPRPRRGKGRGLHWAPPPAGWDSGFPVCEARRAPRCSAQPTRPYLAIIT